MKKTGIVLAAFAVILIAIILFFTRDPELDILSDEEIKKVVSEQYPGEITELSFDSDTASYKVKVESAEQEYEVFVDSRTGEVQSIEQLASNKLAKKDEAKLLDETEESSEGDDEVIEEEQSSEMSETINEEQYSLDVREKINDGHSPDVSEKASEEQRSPVNNDKVKEQQSAPNNSNNVNKQQSTPKDNEKKQPETRNKVKESKEEPAKNNVKANEKQESSSPLKEKKNAMLSHDEIKRIALNEFQGTITELELDDDDGRLLYEVGIENNEDEATIEIDAYTGQVIMVEIDRDD